MHWGGEWIGYDEPADGKVFDPKKPFYCADDFDKGENDYFLPPAPYLRKEFELERKVKSAKIYISAFGLADVRINGEPVGSDSKPFSRQPAGSMRASNFSPSMMSASRTPQR